jgi:hypothetical protein
VAGRGTFDAGSRRDLEIASTALGRAFAAEIALFVGSHRNIETIREIF